MKLLAIDQGSKKCGYAYLDKGEVKEAGHIKLKGKDRKKRYKELIMRLMDMISDENIKYMAIEDVYSKRSRYNNPKVLKIMGETRGIITGVGLMYDLEILDINPSELTSYLGINTRTQNKKEMTQMYVTNLLGYKVSEDASDAVIIGLIAYGRIKLEQNSLK